MRHLPLAASICFLVLTTVSGQAPQPPVDRFVVRQGDRYGFINRSGTVIIPLQYTFAVDFAEGLAPVFFGGSCGYIDPAGNTVIPFVFQYCRQFTNGFAGVQTPEGGWTFIDPTGRPISEERFAAVNGFSDGLGAVQIGEHWGLVDSAGRMAFAAQYRSPFSFVGGRATVFRAGDWRCAVIDETGATVFQPEGTDCRGRLADAMIIREREWRTGKYAYLRPDGTFLTPFAFEWAEPFAEDLAPVRVNGHIGFIDRTGQIAIKPEFDADFDYLCRRKFSEGLSAVQINGRCGYIDATGQVRIAPRFRIANPFSSGIAQVFDSQGMAYINKAGHIVWASREFGEN